MKSNGIRDAQSTVGTAIALLLAIHHLLLTKPIGIKKGEGLSTCFSGRIINGQKILLISPMEEDRLAFFLRSNAD